MSWLQKFINWIFGNEPEKPKPVPVPTPVPVDPHVPPVPAPPVPVPIPIPPDPAPAPVGRVSATQSRVWIIADKPFPISDQPQGFKTGDRMTLMTLAADIMGRGLSGVSVRGIIDATDGSNLETTPSIGITRADGTFAFRYTMRAEDQIPNGSKVIVPIFIDPVGQNTVAGKVAILWDDV